jgi:hypothetical protein
MSLPLIGAGISAVIWLLLPSGRRTARAATHHHGHGAPWPLILLAAAVVGVIVAGANRQRILAVAAKPPPPKVVHVTNTVTRYVPVHVGSANPWVPVVITGIACLAGLGVVALIARAVRSFS